MIRLYWWGGGKGDAGTNFGDSLSPLVVRLLSGAEVAYAPIERCDLVAAGSLLNAVIRRQWRRTLAWRLEPIKVWGTGSLSRRRLDARPRLAIAAVRGPLTRDAMGLPKSTALGDPGILVDRLVGRSARAHRWGIVPHYVDYSLPAVQEMARRTPDSCIVDLRQPDVLATARTIASCDFILSSSLHGLIAADAFGIPSVWVSLSDGLVGGDWKFRDYFQSVEREVPVPAAAWGDLRQLEALAGVASRPAVEARQHDLVQAFRAMGW